MLKIETRINSLKILRHILTYKFLLTNIAFLLFINNSAVAQSKLFLNTSKFHSKNSITNFGEDLNIGLNTGYKILTSPAQFETKDWIYTGIAFTSIGLTFLIDNNIRNNIKNEHTPLFDNIASVGYKYEDIFYGATFSGVIYLGGKLFKNEEYSKTGRMLLESLFYAGVITTVLKSIVGRSRPFTNEGASHFKLFQLKTETTSFPSGHTTVAFVISSVLAERIDNVYASAFLYLLASSTVFQRIYDDKHWTSDTLLGALIGYTIGKAVVKFDVSQESNKLSVSTCYFPDGVGLNIKYSF